MSSSSKGISGDDRIEILDVINRVAFILDSGAYDDLSEVFSADMHFDNPGRLSVDGLSEVIAAFGRITDPAISHHITNVVITPVDGGTVQTLSKALALRSGNVVLAAEYSDVLTKTDAGWRISSRSIRKLP